MVRAFYHGNIPLLPPLHPSIRSFELCSRASSVLTGGLQLHAMRVAYAQGVISPSVYLVSVKGGSRACCEDKLSYAASEEASYAV